MGILDQLPTVDNCFCCINLKVATILIALLGIFSLGIGIHSSYSRECRDESQLQDFMGYFLFILVAIQIMVLLTSIILIYGVIAGKANTATWFMYTVLVSIAAYLVYFIISLISGINSSECPFPLYNVISAAICVFFWVYFVIVVKSYQSEM